MKNHLVLLLLLSVSVFWPEWTVAQENSQYFEVPLKYVNFLLLNDGNSPIQLSKPFVLSDDKGYLEHFYTISNRANSSVKSLRIEEFDAFVNPSYSAQPYLKEGFTLEPYESLSMFDEARMNIVQLGEKRAREFGFSEDKKRIWIVLVTKVELYDGTTYDATSRFSAIKEFIDQIQRSEDLLDDDAPRPFREKERKLQKFIVDTMKKDIPR
jgi:hypothetical protein